MFNCWNAVEKWSGEAGGHVISAFLASICYLNTNSNQIKTMDMNRMIIYLVFHQKLNFLANRERARSKNADFCLSSVDSAVSSQTRIMKIKLKPNKLEDFSKLSLNIVVFGLHCLLFEAGFKHELKNINFQYFWSFVS